MSMGFLEHFGIKIPGLGDTLVAMGGHVDLAEEGQEHTSIILATRKVYPVLKELGAELPPDEELMSIVDADFQLVDDQELQTVWEFSTATVKAKDDQKISFQSLKEAADKLIDEDFRPFPQNAFVEPEIIRNLMVRPKWAADVVCPVMLSWFEDQEGIMGSHPTDVQLFTCTGIKPNWSAYEEERRNWMKNQMPFQRAVYPSFQAHKLNLPGV